MANHDFSEEVAGFQDWVFENPHLEVPSKYELLKTIDSRKNGWYLTSDDLLGYLVTKAVEIWPSEEVKKSLIHYGFGKFLPKTTVTTEVRLEVVVTVETPKSLIDGAHTANAVRRAVEAITGEPPVVGGSAGKGTVVSVDDVSVVGFTEV